MIFRPSWLDLDYLVCDYWTLWTSFYFGSTYTTLLMGDLDDY